MEPLESHLTASSPGTPAILKQKTEASRPSLPELECYEHYPLSKFGSPSEILDRTAGNMMENGVSCSANLGLNNFYPDERKTFFSSTGSNLSKLHLSPIAKEEESVVDEMKKANNEDSNKNKYVGVSNCESTYPKRKDRSSGPTSSNRSVVYDDVAAQTRKYIDFAISGGIADDDKNELEDLNETLLAADLTFESPQKKATQKDTQIEEGQISNDLIIPSLQVSDLPFSHVNISLEKTSEMAHIDPSVKRNLKINEAEETSNLSLSFNEVDGLQLCARVDKGMKLDKKQTPSNIRVSKTRIKTAKDIKRRDSTSRIVEEKEETRDKLHRDSISSFEHKIDHDDLLQMDKSDVETVKDTIFTSSDDMHISQSSFSSYKNYDDMSGRSEHKTQVNYSCNKFQMQQARNCKEEIHKVDLSPKDSCENIDESFGCLNSSVASLSTSMLDGLHFLPKSVSKKETSEEKCNVDSNIIYDHAIGKATQDYEKKGIVEKSEYEINRIGSNARDSVHPTQYEVLSPQKIDNLGSARQAVHATSKGLSTQLQKAAIERRLFLSRENCNVHNTSISQHVDRESKSLQRVADDLQNVVNKKNKKEQVQKQLQKQAQKQGWEGLDPYRAFKARPIPRTNGPLSHGGQAGVPKISKRPPTQPFSPKLGSRNLHQSDKKQRVAKALKSLRKPVVNFPPPTTPPRSRASVCPKPKLKKEEDPYKPFIARPLPGYTSHLGHGGQMGVPKVEKRLPTVANSPKLGYSRKSEVLEIRERKNARISNLEVRGREKPPIAFDSVSNLLPSKSLKFRRQTTNFSRKKQEEMKKPVQPHEEREFSIQKDQNRIAIVPKVSNESFSKNLPMSSGDKKIARKKNNSLKIDGSLSLKKSEHLCNIDETAVEDKENYDTIQNRIQMQRAEINRLRDLL